MSLREKAIATLEANKAQIDRERELKQQAFNELLARDIEEGPNYILSAFGVKAVFSGKTSFQGVHFDLLDPKDEQPVADQYSGKFVQDEAVRKNLSNALYVTQNRDIPVLRVEIYSLTEKEWAGTIDCKDAVDLWNALHTRAELWDDIFSFITDDKLS